MSRDEAVIRINELRETIREYSRRYYVDNAPVISDYEFDHLMYELEDLERQFPEFITPDSPTQRVGSDLESQGTGVNAEPSVRKEFSQYQHRYPMLSLGNTYSIEEIEEFEARTRKLLDGVPFSYTCELKYDGVAVGLTYRGG